MATAKATFHREQGFDSDTDVETVDPSVDLVVFEDTPKIYSPSEDIFLVYYLGKDCTPSSRDWVGLYPLDWTSTKDYVTYEWAPKFPRDSKHPYVRSVLFNARNLQVEPSQDDFYQFLYITKHCQVIGVSKKFHIHDVEPMESLVCVERPLKGINSLTFIEYKLEKSSLHGFEPLGDQLSNRSTSVKSSDFHLSKLFELNQESRDTSDFKLDPRFSEPVNTIIRTESSDYCLEWLFQQTEEEKGLSSDESRYKDVIFAPKQEYTWAQVVKGISDICDGQWEDPCLEVPETSIEPIVEKHEATNTFQTVDLYEPMPVVPYHKTEIIPYIGSGPLVPYQPIFIYGKERSSNTSPENEDKEPNKEEKDHDEALLTAVYTRYFKDTKKNFVVSQVMDMPVVKKLVDLIKESFPPLASLNMKKLAICSKNAEDKPIKVAVRRRKLRKPKCKKCVQKNRTIRHTRKECQTYKQLVTDLEKDLEASDSELLVKSVVMEDLSQQVKDFAHDTIQLENMYAKLLKEKTVEKTQAHSWLQHTIQALQQENQELKVKSEDLQTQVSNLSKIHAERKIEWHTTANQKANFHLATISCQEKTIVNLTNERNRVVEQLQKAKNQIKMLVLQNNEANETASQVSIRQEKLQNEVNMANQEEKKLKVQLELERRNHLCEKHKFVLNQDILTAKIRRLEKELNDNKMLLADQSKTGMDYRVSSFSQTPITKTDSSSCQTPSDISGSSFTESMPLFQAPPGTPPSTKLNNCFPIFTPSTEYGSTEAGSKASDPKRAKTKPVKVAARGPARKGKTEQTSSASRDVKTSKKTAKENTSSFNFFASGFDFFSSFKPTFTEFVSDSSHVTASAPSAADIESGPIVKEPSSSADSDDTPDTDTLSWAEMVDEEEKTCDRVSYWFKDFSPSWKPKSGKKAERKVPGHVRFAGETSSTGGSSVSGCTGNKWSKRRHTAGSKRRIRMD